MENRYPSKTVMNRFFAYALTRLTYRDIELLEDNHAISIPLNMEFYNRMLVEVQQNYEKELPRIISVMYEPPKTKQDCELAKCLKMLLASIDSWEKPVKVSDKFKGSIAEFVLSGTFLNACLQGYKLTDTLMKELNIDVHNRYFTLICRGIVKVSAE